MLSRDSLRWALTLAITVAASVLTVACGGKGDNDMMAVLEREGAAYQARDATAYAALFASDARWEDYSAFADRVQGRDEVERVMGAWFKIVPEHHTFTTELVIRDEHMLWGRGRMSGPIKKGRRCASRASQSTKWRTGSLFVNVSGTTAPR